MRAQPIARLRLGAVAALSLVAACGDQLGPAERRVQLAAVGGQRQFAEDLATLDAPLEVLATDPATGEPVEDVQVTWHVVRGMATPTPAASASDVLGVARTSLRLGLGQPGDTVRVQATSAGSIGSPAVFEAHYVTAPTITGVAPATIRPGETVTIMGSGFLPATQDNAVLFAGVRGTVMSARPDRLLATAPDCLLNRTADVRVQLGQAASEPYPVQTVSPDGTILELELGEVATFDAADVGCVRLAAPAAAAYLVIAQNAADVLGLPTPFRLLASVGDGPAAAVELPAARPRGTDWELALRARERSLLAGPVQRERSLLPDAAGLAQLPRIGDRKDFNVLNEDQKTVRINAEVRAITSRAVLYIDRDTPANGFGQADLESLGALFDDPIYATVGGVFGEPTDVDGNQRVIILFTPRVNALTARGEDGFIAGYFYGCDLVTAARCAATNRAEIFYSMVPDPQGAYGDVRTRSDVLRTVPAILAHEFQHMVHFGRKDGLDVLWLSEALAHTAEDLVGRVFRARGDIATADQFQLGNYLRAHRYLMSTSVVSLLAEASPGTLELRGGAWLLLAFLADHYGGDDLLGRLTRSARTGVANVVAETGQPWATLLSDFAVALWADDAPELFSVRIDRRYTFPNLDLRDDLGRFQGGFGLRPPRLTLHDYILSGSLAPAAQSYVIFDIPAAGVPPFSLGLTGRYGADFPSAARPRLNVLRIR